MYYIMVNVIGLLWISLLLVWITNITGGYISSAHLFCGVWAVAIILSQFLVGGDLLPSLLALNVIYATCILFLGGYLLTLIYPKGHSKVSLGVIINGRSGRILLFALLVWQALAILPVVADIVPYLAGSLRNAVAIFSVNRLRGYTGDVDLPWYLEVARNAHLFYLPLGLVLLKDRKLSLASFVAVCLFAFTIGSMSFTRAPIFQILICILVPWSFIFRPTWGKRIFILTSGFIFMLVVFSFIQNSMFTNNPRSGAVLKASESIPIYLTGSLKAYGIILDSGYEKSTGGLYTLDMVNYVLKKLSYIKEYPELTRHFIYIPYPVNVYTYLDAFTLDFGVLGALLGSFLTGALVGLAFKLLSKRKSIFWLILCTYFGYCCAMSVMNNEFIRFETVIVMGMAYLIDRLVLDNPSRAASKKVLSPSLAPSNPNNL